MPLSSQIKMQFASIHSDSISVSKDSVQQTTGITSGVTINSSCGKIVTNTTGNVATSGNANITVTNNKINANSIVLCQIAGYSGSGLPSAFINNVANGSFQVHIKNAHDTNPVAGGFSINFCCL